MTLQIPLSPDLESELLRQAAEEGTDLASFVLQAVAEKLAYSQSARDDAHRRRQSTEQWLAEFREWVASHRPLPYEADDSRETIYAGRGE